MTRATIFVLILTLAACAPRTIEETIRVGRITHFDLGAGSGIVTLHAADGDIEIVFGRPTEFLGLAYDGAGELVWDFDAVHRTFDRLTWAPEHLRLADGSNGKQRLAGVKDRI